MVDTSSCSSRCPKAAVPEVVGLQRKSFHLGDGKVSVSVSCEESQAKLVVRRRQPLPSFKRLINSVAIRLTGAIVSTAILLAAVLRVPYCHVPRTSVAKHNLVLVLHRDGLNVGRMDEEAQRTPFLVGEREEKTALGSIHGSGF
jgi:hypothetical protein